MKKVIGRNYLHSHPMEENAKGIDSEHCIVDKKNFEKCKNYLKIILN